MKHPKQKVCNDKDLVFFHYGELETLEKRRVQQHLESCADCRNRFAALRDTLAGLPLPDLSLSEVETRRLSARITERATQPARRGRWMWGTALAAGSVLALSLWIFPGGFGPFTGVPLRTEAEIGMLQEMELLQNLELLENLDLLQEFERNA